MKSYNKDYLLKKKFLSNDNYSIDFLCRSSLRYLDYIIFEFINRNKIGLFFEDEIIRDYIERLFSIFTFDSYQVCTFYDKDEDLFFLYFNKTEDFINFIFVIKEIDFNFINIDFIDLFNLDKDDLLIINELKVKSSTKIEIIYLLEYFLEFKKCFDNKLINYFLERFKDNILFIKSKYFQNKTFKKRN